MQTNKPTNKTIKCVICSKMFATKSALNQHKSKHKQQGGKSMPMKAYVATQNTIQLMKPKVSNTNDGCVVKNRELVQDIFGSVNFALQVARYINPGLASMFPWLSNIAPNYEMYRFRKLKFIYEPIVPTSSAGTIAMAIDYDASDTQPISKQQMMAYDGAVRCAPWSSVELIVNRQDKILTKRFVTPGGIVPTNPVSDNKLYHLGALDLATQACSITTSNGELYVDYECEFFIPQLQNNIAAYSSGQVTSVSGLTNNSPLGATSTSVGIVDVIGSSPNVVSFQKPGQYLIDLTNIGTAINGGAIITGNGTATTTLLNNLFTATGISAEAIVNVKNILTDTINISTGSTGTLTSGILRVSPYLYA